MRAEWIARRLEKSDGNNSQMHVARKGEISESARQREIMQRHSYSFLRCFVALIFTGLWMIPTARAATYYVATTGNDAQSGTSTLPWRTIQKACNTVPPGSTVYVRPGTYNEKVTVNVSGSAAGGYITITGSSKAVVSGAGKSGENIFYLNNKSYVKIIGFEIRDNLAVSDGSGIRVEGSGNHIELHNNRIHEIRGTDAMGITVYGTVGATPIANLIIDGNEIYDCSPARSEALTLNGNVANFQVTNNYVHDVNNIGIDFIGGEGMSPTAATDAARNGICRGNRVFRARSTYEGGYAGAIYVDGGRDIVIENNTVSESDLGIEIGAENYGIVTSNITVRNNFIYKNDKAGLVFGGYDSTAGRVTNCKFLNNTLYGNDTLGLGNGELWIQYASGNIIKNNIFFATAQNKLLTALPAGTTNTLDYNLWYVAAGANAALFDWGNASYTGFAAYRAGSGRDANSLFLNPLLRSATNLHIASTSPAINRGDPSFVAASGEVDMDKEARVMRSRVDIGADEVPSPPAPPANLAATAFSSQIDLNWTDQATNETTFYVYRSTDGITFTLRTTLRANTTSYTDLNLPASQTYHYRIRASNAGGHSAYSNIASATTS